MTTATEALDTLAEVRRPCPCDGIGVGCALCGMAMAHSPHCSTCHGEGTMLVFPSLWRECCQCYPDRPHTARRFFDGRLMAVGFLIQDVYAMDSDPMVDALNLWWDCASDLGPEILFETLYDASFALGWAKEATK